MTHEDKELLLKDLCSRLPHHVRVKVWLKDGTTEEGFLDLEHNYADVLRDTFYYNKIKDIKPYLRPLSSMTKKEYKELKSVSQYYGFAPYEYIGDWCPNYEMADYLNKNHFDYRGLIEKGLAIEVAENNNPYKQS